MYFGEQRLQYLWKTHATYLVFREVSTLWLSYETGCERIKTVYMALTWISCLI